MSPAGGIWASAALRAMRKHFANNARMATKMLRSKLSAATRPLNAAELQPIAVRTGSARQPVHPAAWLRQQKRVGGAKWFSTATVRRFISTGGHTTPGSKPGFRFDRSKLPTSTISRAVNQLTGRAPFASTLRPNLTGGTLGRTAGGYGIPGSGRIGGVRHFSHTPAAPAQVVQNVTQAMRAFWLSGQRARFDGVGPNGDKRYRAVSAMQEEARVRMEKAMMFRRPAPGAFVDFNISPTVTALSPLGAAMVPFGSVEEQVAAAGAATLNAEGFLDVLSVDFARALKDLAAIMTDLQSLAGLGDLPIVLEKNNIIRVRFPGMDAETVERLCDDVGIKRGVVGQDPDFNASAAVEVALRFPFAPDGGDDTITSPGGSVRSRGSESTSDDVEEVFMVQAFEENPWQFSGSEPEGYESMSPPVMSSSGEHCSDDFEGLEGIYRFLEECDRARGRFQ
ncbi:hypothetical protein VTI74DRAFT_5467 [Chaetomium olivicolor]